MLQVYPEMTLVRIYLQLCYHTYTKQNGYTVLDFSIVLAEGSPNLSAH